MLAYLLHKLGLIGELERERGGLEERERRRRVLAQA